MKSLFRSTKENTTIGSFLIKKETGKAFQIEEDGKVFWIQKKWMRDDGTLTAAGEKSRAAAKAPVQGIKLASSKVEIPAEIKRMFDTDPSMILWNDSAKRSGKWIVIEIGSMGSGLSRGSLFGIKDAIRDITGKAAFLKVEPGNRSAKAGWLAE